MKPIWLIIGMLVSLMASAQEKTNLSLEKSIELGLQNSKSLHSSRMSVEAYEAKASEVNASRLPSLKLNGSYTRLSDVPPFTQTIPAGTFGPQQQELSITLSPVVLNNYNLRLSLQQPLFTGWRLESSSSIARLSAMASAEDFEKQRGELVYDITNAYWNLYKAIEFKKVVDENVDQVKAHLSDVKSLMNQGMATTNDMLRVQVQLSNTELLEIDATNNVHLGSLALNNTIGQPLTSEFQPVSTPDSGTGKNPGDLNSLVQQGLEQRHELKSMQYRCDASDAGVTLAKSAWYPQFYLTGNYNYARPNARILPTEDRFNGTWDVGVTASLDIWNWGSTIYQTQQAQAQRAQAQDALSQLRDGIVLEITQAFLNVNQAKERIGVSEQAVQQAAENYRVTNEKFKLGIALNSDLLDAEVALLQAKWNHIQSLVDYELAQARLRKSVGA